MLGSVLLLQAPCVNALERSGRSPGSAAGTAAAHSTAAAQTRVLSASGVESVPRAVSGRTNSHRVTTQVSHPWCRVYQTPSRQTRHQRVSRCKVGITTEQRKGRRGNHHRTRRSDALVRLQRLPSAWSPVRKPERAQAPGSQIPSYQRWTLLGERMNVRPTPSPCPHGTPRRVRAAARWLRLVIRS